MCPEGSDLWIFSFGGRSQRLPLPPPPPPPPLANSVLAHTTHSTVLFCSFKPGKKLKNLKPCTSKCILLFFLGVQRAVCSAPADAAQIIDSGGASISFLCAPPHPPLRLITLHQFQTSPKRLFIMAFIWSVPQWETLTAKPSRCLAFNLFVKAKTRISVAIKNVKVKFEPFQGCCEQSATCTLKTLLVTKRGSQFSWQFSLHTCWSHYHPKQQKQLKKNNLYVQEFGI